MSSEPIRVVFADDDEAMRTLVSTLLQLADGVEVVGQAVDGAEAVELVEPPRAPFQLGVPHREIAQVAQGTLVHAGSVATDEPNVIV